LSEQEQESDRSTAADRVPIERDRLPESGHETVELSRVGGHRRQSRMIPHPRKWKKTGLSEVVCPECRAKIPSISDGTWHLQTAHSQGKGLDLEAWGRDLRDELDEFIDAAEGRTGYVADKAGQGTERMTALLLAAIVAIAVIGVIYLVATLYTFSHH
jgi:hypothetical protein